MPATARSAVCRQYRTCRRPRPASSNGGWKCYSLLWADCSSAEFQTAQAYRPGSAVASGAPYRRRHRPPGRLRAPTILAPCTSRKARSAPCDAAAQAVSQSPHCMSSRSPCSGPVHTRRDHRRPGIGRTVTRSDHVRWLRAHGAGRRRCAADLPHGRTSGGRLAHQACAPLFPVVARRRSMASAYHQATPTTEPPGKAKRAPKDP